jgi:hypothetical protein
VAKLEARLFATEALWFRTQTSLKNAKWGDISTGAAENKVFFKSAGNVIFVEGTYLKRPTHLLLSCSALTPP